MPINFLLKQFQENPNKEAIIWNGQIFLYHWLSERIRYWQDLLVKEKIPEGTVLVIEADFSPNAIALFLALIQHKCIIVPLTASVASEKTEFMEIAQTEVVFTIDAEDRVSIQQFPRQATHEYYQSLRNRQNPGLILFSSGSTGKSKAALHDLSYLLEKFKVPRRSLRTITFLLYDHIGGVNTMLYTLSNIGCIITVKDRTPEAVLQTIERYHAEILPTSPTFLNLIILSETYKNFNFSSIKTVTYGTEPMQESTLKRFHDIFPDVQLLQTYGLSEIGILRSKSKNSNSLWVKVGGEGYDIRIIDGTLQIKAKSAMLGYLNAPNPFTEDGWFNTGDVVEQDGDYIKILGRQSEIINIGGEKVYPAEVESVIQKIKNISEVTVYGEAHPITGQIVCAQVSTVKPIDLKTIRKTIKKYCKQQLPNYKIPIKISVVDQKQHSERFKKLRNKLPFVTSS